MKAITYYKYGSPEELRVEEILKPEPGPEEILVKVEAASITAGDTEVRRFKINPLFWIPVRLMFGVFKPRNKVLGQELAGTVLAKGAKRTDFEIGDRVVSGTGANLGAHAEYCILKKGLPTTKLPDTISFEDAATFIVGGLNAVHFIDLANISTGDHVLINGAGGSIGTYCVQLAKHLGAKVSAVDNHHKLELLTELGADKVIDYEKENPFAQASQYDKIIDIIVTRDYSSKLKSLKPGGSLIITNPDFEALFQTLIGFKNGQKKIRTGLASEDLDRLNQVLELHEKGIFKPSIDRMFKPEEMVEAHKYIEAGLKRGNAILKFES